MYNTAITAFMFLTEFSNTNLRQVCWAMQKAAVEMLENVPFLRTQMGHREVMLKAAFMSCILKKSFFKWQGPLCRNFDALPYHPGWRCEHQRVHFFGKTNQGPCDLSKRKHEVLIRLPGSKSGDPGMQRAKTTWTNMIIRANWHFLFQGIVVQCTTNARHASLRQANSSFDNTKECLPAELMAVPHPRVWGC